MGNEANTITKKEEAALECANEIVVLEALKKILQTAYGCNNDSRRCSQFILSLWNGRIWKCNLQDLIHDENFANFFMVMEYLKKTRLRLCSIVSKEEIISVMFAQGHNFDTEKMEGHKYQNIIPKSFC